MKAPRTSDFDPKAATLKSPLDDMPAIVAPPPAAEAGPAVPAVGLIRTGMINPGAPTLESTPGGPPEPPPVRTPVRVKRTITRYAFEFFQDQIERLKKFSLDEQLVGEKGSMSQMVREALDSYIANRMRTEG